MAALPADWEQLLRNSDDRTGAMLTTAGDGDLLATLLASGDQFQDGKLTDLELPGNDGDLQGHANGIDLLNILAAGDATDHSVHGLTSPDSISSTHSAFSQPSPASSNTSGAATGPTMDSPISSFGSASGHEGDVSAVSSPGSVNSMLAGSDFRTFQAACPSGKDNSGAPNVASTNCSTDLQSQFMQWGNANESLSLDSLLADSSLPMTTSALSIEAQLAVLRGSLDAPGLAATTAEALSFNTNVDVSLMSTSMASTAGSTVTTKASAREVAIDLSFSTDQGFSNAFSDHLASGSRGQDMASDGLRERLVLTSEEKRLLTAENVELPEYLPLTKQEEKNLKRIRRKIKNKISALDSRKRKREYVDGLETRVQSTTDENRHLQKRVRTLEDTNKNLMAHLKKLQDIVTAIYPSPKPIHTGVAVFVLSFALFLVPGYFPDATPTAMEVSMAYVGGKVRTRVLLAADDSEGVMSTEMPPPASPFGHDRYHGHEEEDLADSDSDTHDFSLRHADETEAEVAADREVSDGPPDREAGDDEVKVRAESGGHLSGHDDSHTTAGSQTDNSEPHHNIEHAPLDQEEGGTPVARHDQWESDLPDASALPVRDEI